MSKRIHCYTYLSTMCTSATWFPAIYMKINIEINITRGRYIILGRGSESQVCWLSAKSVQWTLSYQGLKYLAAYSIRENFIAEHSEAW